MSITPLPSAPQPTDSTAQFNTKAFAWVAALDTWTTEANALGSQVSLDATSASEDAAIAEAAAATAVSAANAVAWVTGTTYETGDVVYSPIDFQTYRRKTDGAGSTDPSADSTNWEVISGNVSTSNTQTLSNKTITGTKETKATISASEINLASGNYFTKTITATTTFTLANVPATGTAVSFLLDITNGGSQTVNLWSNIKWANGVAPTLTASGRDVLGFFTHDNGTIWNGFVLGKDLK